MYTIHTQTQTHTHTHITCKPLQLFSFKVNIDDMKNNCYNNKREVREVQSKESCVDVQTVYFVSSSSYGPGK